ncbi:MAG TPA: hypothetical protein VE779_11230, partial [Candidatus Angelobacter sp.]|nr:hypothetical protein [Candidatus Angelobacter sp.]
MRLLVGIVAAFVLSLAMCAQEAPTASSNAAPPGEAPPAEAASATTIVPPPPTKKDVAAAKQLFAAGVRLKSSGKMQEAFEKFTQAARLDPRSVEYLTAREMTRQQLVMDALERGNKAMLANNEVAAAAEFRRALEFDPGNEFARQRLKDSIWEAEPAASRTLQVAQRSIDVQVSPSSERKDFHLKGDSKSMLTQVARAYGITATLDDSVQTRQLHFNIDNVNFAEAMEAATQVTKTFWIALSGSQMYVVADTLENRRNFERLAIRTFYLNDVLSPQELTDTVNALRQILSIRFVQQDAAENTVTIRAPLPVVEAATRLIDSLAGGRPQVTLDVR